MAIFKENIKVKGGAGAKIQLLLLKTAGLMLLPINLKGFGKVVKVLGKLFSPQNKVVLPVFSNSFYTVYLNDYYWISQIFNRTRYEPEIEFTIRKLVNSENIFLDCGSNYGYWSIYACELGAETIAVEASTENFKKLQENAKLNENKFKVLNNALSDKSGEELKFSKGSSHAGHHLLSEGEETEFETVKTISIDDLVDKYCSQNKREIIIKLDVEGAEIASLEGAKNTIETRDVIFAYEDHGSETDHNNSKAFVEADFMIFYVKGEKIKQIVNAEELDEIKTNPSTGYNFLACKGGSGFLKRLK